MSTIPKSNARIPLIKGKHWHNLSTRQLVNTKENTISSSARLGMAKISIRQLEFDFSQEKIWEQRDISP